MRVLTADHIDLWTRGVGIVALVAVAGLGWAVFVPTGVVWTNVLLAGVIGTVVVTSVFMRRRPTPSLAQVIARAQSEPVVGRARSNYRGGSGIRPRGGRKP